MFPSLRRGGGGVGISFLSEIRVMIGFTPSAFHRLKVRYSIDHDPASEEGPFLIVFAVRELKRIVIDTASDIHAEQPFTMALGIVYHPNGMCMTTYHRSHRILPHVRRVIHTAVADPVQIQYIIDDGMPSPFPIRRVPYLRIIAEESCRYHTIFHFPSGSLIVISDRHGCPRERLVPFLHFRVCQFVLVRWPRAFWVGGMKTYSLPVNHITDMHDLITPPRFLYVETEFEVSFSYYWEMRISDNKYPTHVRSPVYQEACSETS